MVIDLFDYEDFDGVPQSTRYFNVTLKRKIGVYPQGVKFKSARIEIFPNSTYGHGYLSFYCAISGNLLAKFKLHYQVGELESF